MQFHLDGFKGADDPLKLQFDGIEPDFQSSLPPEVDVLIIGAGPAGDSNLDPPARSYSH